MASDTVAFLERVVGGAARVVGCSAGASVALLVALRRPDLVRRLVLIAGVFHRDGWVQDAIDPDVSPPEVLARGYPELSPDACVGCGNPVSCCEAVFVDQSTEALSTFDLIWSRRADRSEH
jgi:pimeloyl-ACP methyl ester carboxylesterase